LLISFYVPAGTRGRFNHASVSHESVLSLTLWLRAISRTGPPKPSLTPAAEGGGRKARLYKGYASSATIATGGRRTAVRGDASRAQRLGRHRAAHSKFNRAEETITSHYNAFGHDSDSVDKTYDEFKFADIKYVKTGR
jgi:hypothetical protein